MKLKQTLCNLCVVLFALVLFSCEDEADKIMKIGDTEIEMICDGNHMVVFEIMADELGIDWGDYSLQKGIEKGRKEKFSHNYELEEETTITLKGSNIRQLVYSADIIKVIV